MKEYSGIIEHRKESIINIDTLYQKVNIVNVINAVFFTGILSIVKDLKCDLKIIVFVPLIILTISFMLGLHVLMIKKTIPPISKDLNNLILDVNSINELIENATDKTNLSIELIIYSIGIFILIFFVNFL